MTNAGSAAAGLYLAGAPIASLMFWVPQSGDIGMGVSIISYNAVHWHHYRFGAMPRSRSHQRALCQRFSLC
jgi:hypothetical protein